MEEFVMIAYHLVAMLYTDTPRLQSNDDEVYLRRIDYTDKQEDILCWGFWTLIRTISLDDVVKWDTTQAKETNGPGNVEI